MRPANARALLSATLALAAASAFAADWGSLATISSTMGANANRICLGEGLRVGDIGCPSYAPSVTTAGDVSITGNVSANRFIGDGSGLSGVGSAVSPTGAIQFSANGAGAFGGDVSNLYWDNVNKRLGLGTSLPTYDVDIIRSGTVAGIRIVDSSVSGQLLLGETSSAANFFSPFIGGSPMGGANAATYLYSTLAVASDSGATPAMVFVSRLVGGNAPVATRPTFQWRNGTINQMTLLSNGNLGVSTSNPTAKLDVNGDAAVSGTVKIAGTGSETCNAAAWGTFRFNPDTGAPQICVNR